MQIERLEDFIANMPKSLSTNTEKARWLYIELGKRSFYDVSYGFLNEDEEQELMYDHKNYKNPKGSYYNLDGKLVNPSKLK